MLWRNSKLHHSLLYPFLIRYRIRLVDCYSSYFGAFTCIAWSPDGRFILTGGQDDLLTIFSPWEQRVVARCQGHSSFVSCVSFDETRCDGRTYRFGSVGEDNKLILVSPSSFDTIRLSHSTSIQWDFSSGALHRPKNHLHSHSHRQSLIGTYSNTSLAFRSRSSGGPMSSSALYLPPSLPPSSPPPHPFDYTTANESHEGDDYDLTHSQRYHPAPSRNEVAVVQPVLIKSLYSTLPSSLNTSTVTAPPGLHTPTTATTTPTSSSSATSTTPDPLPTAIAFLPKHLLTSTKNGVVKLWVRPLSFKAVGVNNRAGR